MANVQLAKNLKILRKKHNYTQQDLSDILNITRQAYSHYEQALREPDLNTLVHLSHLYKVSLDELHCRQYSSRRGPGIHARLQILPW